jgi:thymidylate synthase ThyX
VELDNGFEVVSHAPKVFVIGSSQMHRYEMQDYLAYRGVEWYRKSEPVVNSHSENTEILVEAAGRVCYHSWDNKSDKTTKEYIQSSIIEHAHGCYDIETDVLTKNGWKNWPDVTYDDELATLTEEGVIEYHKPKRLIHFPYEGPMYHVDARGVNLFVTPQHKMLACKTTTVEGRKRETFELISAEQLGNSSHAYRKDGLWDAGEATLSNPEAWLLGFAIGDGRVSANTVSFHLKKKRKITELYECAEELNLRVAVGEDNWYSLTIPKGKLQDAIKSIYNSDREKVIPQSLLTDSNKDVLNYLYLGLIDSDGHRSPTGVSFDTTSIVLRNQMQQLCLHIGLAANHIYSYNASQRQSSFGTKTLHRLSIISRELRPEVNKYVDMVGRTEWVENWSGDVFCAEVQNNTLFVRRDGKPVWSGNSVLEHVWLNFMVADLPRSSQLELVRHGDGTAFSFESTRFTDEHLRFIVPPRLRGNVEAVDTWYESVRTAVRVYWNLLSEIDANEPSATLRRKRRKEAARSILPACQGSDGVVSMNARSLRWITEVRSDPGADLSIREFANEVFVAAQEYMPSILADASFEDDGEGVLSIKYATKKV